MGEEAIHGAARPDTHILLMLLRDFDFYHASATIKGQRQRAKRQGLCAEKYAEISLLRRLGWRVCGLPEHLWTWGPDGDPDVSRANRDFIFRAVANLKDNDD